MDVAIQPNQTVPGLIIEVVGMILRGLSLYFWIQAFVAIRRKQEWLPIVEPRRLQAWGFVDFFFIFFAFFGLQVFGQATAVVLKIGSRNAEGEGLDLVFQTWMSLLGLAVLFFGTGFIALRQDRSPDELGFSLRRLGYDTALGFRAFVMFAPLTHLLMFFATTTSGVPYEHPLLDEAKDRPELLIPVLLMAVVSAPLLEEYVFRVLLQGFLESMSIGQFSLKKMVLGRGVVERDPMNDQVTDSMQTPALSPPAPLPEDGARGDEEARTDRIPVWPTIVSGILFGLAHFSFGVSWVPLCLLGVSLGWLYRATNRIWPSVVMHMCFNSFTTFVFAVHVLFGIPIH